MIIKGFKFGMLLQIAIGPICLFVFQTAVVHGFIGAIISVIGVTICDAFFIVVAIWGLGTLLNKSKNIKKFLQLFGAVVLIGFGASNIMGGFGLSIMPNLDILIEQKSNSIFLRSMILTLGNPLTILFWAGIFSSKIVEENMNKMEMYLFGIGSVISTVFFLTMISGVGYFVNELFSSKLISIFNILVGVFLVFFGIKTALKKDLGINKK